jgi:two-component sensor histidine kinase
MGDTVMLSSFRVCRSVAALCNAAGHYAGGVKNRMPRVQTKPPPAGTVPGLALAVIASSNTPVLLLGGDLVIVAASASFCRAFAIDPAQVAGRTLAALGAGEWGAPQLGSLLATVAAGHTGVDAYEMDLKREGHHVRHLVLNAEKLEYGDTGNVRLLLAITDVTGARQAERVKDDLLREKAVLLQELQHRVANSLQIIASVLMQSAKRVQSEETRTHLHDAHHRVMSVAALQRQLAVSRQGDVVLRDYFGDLCRSIGTSMISDQTQLVLEVTADDSVATPEVSMSLGLIVTELVINALKHAFPDHRGGRIRVEYGAHGEDWTLTVADDGVGTGQAEGDTPDHPPKSGLGTGIVSALAQQLGAVVTVTDAGPGTEVTVAHTQTVAKPKAERARQAV